MNTYDKQARPDISGPGLFFSCAAGRLVGLGKAGGLVGLCKAGGLVGLGGSHVVPRTPLQTLRRADFNNMSKKIAICT